MSSSAKNTGIGAMVVGLFAAVFAAFGLGITLLQQLFFVLEKGGAAADERQFFEALEVLHHAWWIHLPLWMIGGVWLAIWGNRLRTGNARALRVLRVTCWLAIASMAAYLIHVVFVIRAWSTLLFERIPDAIPVVFGVFGLVSALPTFLPFVLLLWGVRRAGREGAGA